MNNQYPMGGIASLLEQQGRYGDTVLMHVNPIEAQGLAALSPTGQLTRNPQTGQPEAFLPMLIPLLASMGGSAAAGAMGAGAVGAGIAGGLASGVATGAITGDWERGLASGIMGAGIGGALGAAGTAAGEAVTASDAALTAVDGVADPLLADTVVGQASMQMPVGAGVDPSTVGMAMPVPPEGLSELANSDVLLGSGDAAMNVADARHIPGDMSTTLPQGDPSLSNMSLEDLTKVQPTAPPPPATGYGSGFDTSKLSADSYGQALKQPFQKDSGLFAEIMKPSKMLPIAYGAGQLAQYDQEEQWAEDAKKLAGDSEAARERSYRNLGLALGEAGYAGGGVVRMANKGKVPEPSNAATPAEILAAIEAQKGLKGDPVAVKSQGYKPFSRLEPLERSYFNSLVPTGEEDWNPFKPYAPQEAQGMYLAPGLYMDADGNIKDKDGNYTDQWGNIIGREENNTTTPIDPEDNLNDNIDISIDDGSDPDPDEGDQTTEPVPSGWEIIDGELVWVGGGTGNTVPGGDGFQVGGPPSQYHAAGGQVRLAAGGDVMLETGRGQIPVAPGGITAVPTEFTEQPVQQADNPMPPMAQPEAGGQPSDQDIQMLAMALTGQAGEQADQIIEVFVRKFGPEMFQEAREFILKMMGGQNAQTEGMIQGQGGGMDDQVMGTIGGQQPVAVSPGEYIVPADVVSGLGDGSSDAGAQELDRMSDDVRMARGGTTTQPDPFDARKVLPA